jgi:hypothetical protein
VKETTISGEAAQAVDDALETPAKLGKITYEQFAK